MLKVNNIYSNTTLKPDKLRFVRFLCLQLLYFFSKKTIGCLTTILLVASSWQASAENIGPKQNYYSVHTFADDWQVYDDRYDAYVPYIKSEHKNYNSFSIFFTTENNKGYKLLYFSPKENYLFINASLQRKMPLKTWVLIDIDSLRAVYQKPNLFLTFYGEESSPEDIQLLIGNPISKVEKSIQISESLLTVTPRDFTAFDDFFVIGLLFLAFSYAFLFNFQPKAFARYFSLKDLLTINPRDDSFIVNKPFDFGNILFVLNLSFTLAFIFMLIQHQDTDLFSVSSILQEGENLLTIVSNFMELGLLIFVVMWLKYLGLLILTNLYRLDNITNMHFFKVIQASGLFFMLVAAGLSVFSVSYSAILANIQSYLIVLIAVFFLLRLLLIYFTINKMTALKNLYLFSYLCIVEVIPLIIGVRYAL